MIRFIHCRTLNSQSAASLTVNNLAAILNEEEFDFDIILLTKNLTKDALSIMSNYEKYDTIIAKINYQDYQYVLFLIESMFSSGFVKNIIVMGAFATLNYHDLLDRYSFINGIILGSGENNIISVAKSIKNNNVVDINIPGCIWRTPNGLVENIESTSIPMKNLPTPFRQVEINETEQLGNLEFSRGCSMGCKYCHITCMRKYQNYVRDSKDVDQVLMDIENLYSIGKRYLIFNDSLFWDNNGDTERIEELCNRLIDMNLDVHFMIYLSLTKFPPISLIKLLRRAGLIRIFIGVESNDENELKKIKLNYSKQITFERFTHLCRELGITYHIGYMVFYPFSTYDKVKKSIEYLISINKIHRVGVILAKMRLIPGSMMYSKYYKEINKNIIDKAEQYRFNDKRVENLYAALSYLFWTVLKGQHANNESLCCSIEMLEEICKRKNEHLLNQIQTELTLFKEQISLYQSILANHIVDLINIYSDYDKEYNSEELISYSNDFISDFSNARLSLQYYWSRLVYKIDTTYQIEIEKQIFTER